MTDFSQNITQQYPIYTETGSRKDRSLIQMSSLSIKALVKKESSVVVSVNMQREYLLTLTKMKIAEKLSQTN